MADDDVACGSVCDSVCGSGCGRVCGSGCGGEAANLGKAAAIVQHAVEEDAELGQTELPQELELARTAIILTTILQQPASWVDEDAADGHARSLCTRTTGRYHGWKNTPPPSLTRLLRLGPSRLPPSHRPPRPAWRRTAHPPAHLSLVHD